MNAKRPAKKTPAKKAGATTTDAQEINETYRAPSEYPLQGGAVFRMPESPLTPKREEKERGISRLTSVEAYHERALGQQRLLLDLADRIQRGDDSLVGWECLMIAGAVRAYASQIYLAPPRGPGNPNRILDPLLTVSYYVDFRRKGLKKYPAMDKVAEKYGVTRASVKAVLDEHADQVELWLEQFMRWEKK